MATDKIHFTEFLGPRLYRRCKREIHTAVERKLALILAHGAKGEALTEGALLEISKAEVAAIGERYRLMGAERIVARCMGRQGLVRIERDGTVVAKPKDALTGEDRAAIRAARLRRRLARATAHAAEQ